MNTLYIADLDGTLLGRDARLCEETVALLRPMIAQGLPFTVATARSPATAVELLRPLALRLPAVLMTGTLLYDLHTHETLETHGMCAAAADAVCDILETTGQEALAYCVKDGQLTVFYREFVSDFEREFISSRIRSPYKTFVQTDSYRAALAGGQPLMFLFCLTGLEAAAAYYTLLRAVAGVTCYFYAYEYGENSYLLEVYPAGCSKASGLAALLRRTGARHVVAFGDNMNDVPLFEAADEGCAMANACDELKRAARHIIGANTENGVARWIVAREGGAL